MNIFKSLTPSRTPLWKGITEMYIQIKTDIGSVRLGPMPSYLKFTPKEFQDIAKLMLGGTPTVEKVIYVPYSKKPIFIRKILKAKIDTSDNSVTWLGDVDFDAILHILKSLGYIPHPIKHRLRKLKMILGENKWIIATDYGNGVVKLKSHDNTTALLYKKL